MKVKLGVGVVGVGALLVGMVIGGVAMRVAGARVVHAQEKAAGASQASAATGASVAPGYVIAEVQVSDMDAMKQYGAKVPAIIEKYGGKYLIVGGRVVTEEGEPTKGFVVIQFESFEKAKEWYDSPEYSAVRPIRQKAAKSRIIIEEGVKE
jgi:uncharacterized protein (DUF1330 family)